jgi:ferric iron reductase protein FhuF
MSNFDRKRQSFYYELNVDSNSTIEVILDHLIDKIRLDELDGYDHVEVLDYWKQKSCLRLRDKYSDEYDKRPNE